MSRTSTDIHDKGEQGERMSFISVYGRIPREVKGKLVWASRRAKMSLSDWCVMILEDEADRLIEEHAPGWDDSRGNR